MTPFNAAHSTAEQSKAEAEIRSQPQCWREVLRGAGAPDSALARQLPAAGETVAVLGCGTSWFIAQAYAVLRESMGYGRTDAFAAAEFPTGRCYQRVLAITRSGTTTEVLRTLQAVRQQGSAESLTVLTANPPAVRDSAHHVVDLGFCDEESVVQTRFATTTLALLRGSLGEDLAKAIGQVEEVLAREPKADWRRAQQFSFLGAGWSVGLAHEAALKMREAALAWTESYPAMEYRHGPISIAQAGRLTWMLGQAPEGLAAEVEATGATFVPGEFDPMVELVRVQLLAVRLAEAAGIDPDHPRHLSRSVVLEGA